MDFTVILLFHFQLQLNFTISWFIEESECTLWSTLFSIPALQLGLEAFYSSGNTENDASMSSLSR